MGAKLDVAARDSVWTVPVHGLSAAATRCRLNCLPIIIAMLMLTAPLLAQDDDPADWPEHPRWNSTPNDINNLLATMKDMVDVHYQMEIKSTDEISVDPELNPIVYYSGHYNYDFTSPQRQKLRKYMLNGGMMIFNTGLGSMPFYRSTRRELALIFPEVQLQRLSSDHPVFHSYYDLDRVKYSPGVYATGFKGNEPWMDGITIDCRTVAIISRFGLAVGWDGGDVLPEYAAYMPESAMKVGVNLLAYATATRAWAKQATEKLHFIDSAESAAGKMGVVQVMYDGEWKTRHAGMSVLLHTFNNKTDVPVRFALQEKKLSDPALFDAPLVYFTGHENFQLNRAEATRLREYVLNGGFVFAEACCGRKGFDLAFRKQMSGIFPEYPLRPIPAGHIIYRLPNSLDELGVTPALAAKTSATIAPRLMGIEVEGHFGVIYSPYGMAGGWEMSQSPYAHGYDASGSVLLGQNILMYAITQ